MKLDTCKFCKNIYNRTAPRNVCPACLQKEEKDYETVRDWLRTAKSAAIAEISEATKVRTESIEYFMESGKLVGGNTDKIQCNCKNCGKPSPGKLLCDLCKRGLENDFKGAVGNSLLNNKKGVSGAKESHLFKGEFKI